MLREPRESKLHKPPPPFDQGNQREEVNLPKPREGDILQLVLRPLMRGWGLMSFRQKRRGGYNLILLKLSFLSACFWAVFIFQRE